MAAPVGAACALHRGFGLEDLGGTLFWTGLHPPQRPLRPSSVMSPNRHSCLLGTRGAGGSVGRQTVTLRQQFDVWAESNHRIRV